MAKQIVILSGHVCAGKSTLASKLAERFGFKHIKTWNFIQARGNNLSLERAALQAHGEQLDQKTKGSWLRDDLQKVERQEKAETLIIVDCVRHPNQIEHLRKAYRRRIVHVHLSAGIPELQRRYEERKKTKTDIAELETYAEVLENKTEAGVEELSKIADIVITSDRCNEEDIVTRVASHLGWYGREYLRLVDVLIGGQYGSEGKGQVASYLASEYDLLIRVGGPNAGHKVKIPGTGETFTFRHLPSGSFASDAPLLIGPGAVMHVPTLLAEIANAKIGVDRLKIDPQAMTISKLDVQREVQLKGSIGSTGQGVGQATSRRIIGRGQSHVKLARDIPDLQPYLTDTCDLLQRLFREGKRALLEGTQGTGLSIFHGRYPHVTSRDTTVAGCLTEAGISPTRVRKVIMVCRTYPIRVGSPAGGDSGRIEGELSWSEIEKRARFKRGEIGKHEIGSVSGNPRRVGEFDWALLRKAATLNAPTDIALTFADYIDKENVNARRFEQLTIPTIRFIEEVERVASAPVTLISTRFHERSIIDRRAW
ncbi:MAG: adenylosuccinate synthase [Candidatus Angelobacter sp.]|nr:adenylosuccinate synthase [Candidatus Angelobacter sp.]